MARSESENNANQTSLSGGSLSSPSPERQFLVLDPVEDVEHEHRNKKADTK